MSADGIFQDDPFLVTFNLRDNTPAEYLVGNVLSASMANIKPARVMLKPDTYFSLTIKGDLYTKLDLDRDTMCGRLDCCSSDTCKLSTEAYIFGQDILTPISIKIIIVITDENDNAPRFLPTTMQFNVASHHNVSFYELDIPESAPVGSQHTLPSATDADSPRFGIQSYKLHSGINDRHTTTAYFPSHNSLPFSLVDVGFNRDSQLTAPPKLRVDQPLDREIKSSYELSLIVEDAGPTVHQAILRIVVNIADINDNPPVFTNRTSNPSISIPEDISVGSVIHRFDTHDADEGGNSNVTLSIDWAASTQGLESTFARKLGTKYEITQSTGELRISRPLDYEEEYERKIILVIRATDHGNPSLTASTSATISLVDVNDNPPVIQIESVDAASDKQSGGTVQLVENQSEPKLLRLISVSDVDSVSTDRLSCRLIDDIQGQPSFKLQPYSSTMYGLSNIRSFDYEKEARLTGYILVSVECIDTAEPQKRTEEWIQIPLVDVNDNWPQFGIANYQFHISEDVKVGTEMGRITATDLDSGSGGKVSYKLSTDEDHMHTYVTIDSVTGVLRTGAKFDREKLSRLDFHVTAMDGGDSREDIMPTGSSSYRQMNIKTNTTSVTLFILDVNDNAPVYVGPAEIHISETAPVGTDILSDISFTDADLGSNGTVTVSLIDQFYIPTHDRQNHNHHYSRAHQPTLVSIVSGSRLVTMSALDREVAPKLIVTLVAKDKGTPVSLSTTTSLTIIMDDVNDNHPQLTYPRNATMLIGLTDRRNWITESTASTIPADTPAGTLVATIRGSDVDAGENGTVTYHMVRGPASHGVTIFSAVESELVVKHNGGYLQDGFMYFQVGEKSGHLSTAWGATSDTIPLDSQSTNRSEKLYSSVTSDISIKPSIMPPNPGLYILNMELRDCGIPEKRTKVVFYVNISEAVGTASAFAIFSEFNVSNTVIFVLITVCSMALIISLTAAIFWVRYRSDSRERHRTGQSVRGGPYTSSYCGPSVVTHDLPSNGFFYPTQNYPTLGSIGNLPDVEQGFSRSLIEGQTMEGFEYASNGFPVKISDSELQNYFGNGGMHGGQTLLSQTLASGKSIQAPQPFHTITYPLQYGMFSQHPSSEPASDVTFLPMATTSTNNPGDWQYTSYDPNMVISPSPITVNQRTIYGMPYHDMPAGPNGFGTNRSNGGSDSGVDSGGAAMNGSLAPTSDSSPNRDLTNRTHNSIAPTNQISFSSNGLHRGRGKPPQGICEVKSFGTTDPVFEVDCSSSPRSGVGRVITGTTGANSPASSRRYIIPVTHYTPSDASR